MSKDKSLTQIYFLPDGNNKNDKFFRLDPRSLGRIKSLLFAPVSDRTYR